MNMKNTRIVISIIVGCVILFAPFASLVGAKCSSCPSTKSVCISKNLRLINYFFWKLIRSLIQFEIQSEIYVYEKKTYQRGYIENEYAVKYDEYYRGVTYSSCAVIIGGGTGSSNFPEISYYAHKVYLGLKRKGFSDENIYYISAEKREGVDAFSNKENVKHALKYWLRTHSGPMTNCYIFLLGHGNHRKDEGLLLLGQGYVGESDIAKWISGLSYKKCLIMVGCCAGSYFKDGLSGKNREILVPSNYYATSHDIAMLIDKALSKIDVNNNHKKLPFYHIPYPYNHMSSQKLRIP